MGPAPEGKSSSTTIDEWLARYMEVVARRLLGEPNRDLSRPGKELRYGNHGSLSVDLKKGVFYDHESGAGGGVLDLIDRELGLANGAALDWLKSELGVTPEPDAQPRADRRMVARYPYRDAAGNLLFEVVRYEPKDFRQRRPDPTMPGGWTWSVQGIDPIPYRLPELLKADPAEPVFIVEGEKDVDRLIKAGVVATCNPGGTGKWSGSFAKWLIGRFVVILPDNDDKGRKHAQDIANKLTGHAASIKIVELPGLLSKGDVSDWLEGGGTAQQLRGMADATAEPRTEDEKPAAAAGQPWPKPLAEEAFHGIIGKIVREIEPETEADPAALLFQLLAGVGNILGTGSFVQIESDKHTPRIFLVQVGRTAKGRKGTSWGRVKSALEAAAPAWAQNRIASGLSSGEGLIYEVRDPVEQQEVDKKTSEKRTVVADPGVTDKRLLVFEGEFAKVLRSMERQGNTLSTVLRDAWDHGNLRTLIKNSPNRATAAHITVIGHITDDELRRYLDRTEIANGLANRLIFICVQRSKLLPRGGGDIDWKGIGEDLKVTLAAAPPGRILCTDEAWALWDVAYPKLSADRPGMLGAILGRAEAQVLRLALIYALLDHSAFIDKPHMLAAQACWDYAEASARFIFGDTLGDPVADEILRVLREQPDGMKRSELMNHFGRHQSSDQIGRALAVLARGNFVTSEKVGTTGRPAERWRAVR